MSTVHPTMLHVGLVAAPTIKITLNGEFRDTQGVSYTGELTLAREDVGLTLTPTTPECSFTVHDMRIGIGFHWDSLRSLTFEGALRVIAEGDEDIRLINDIDIERYLCSVISSEMSADASDALLRAHTVISRSWVLAQTVHRQAVRDESATQNSASGEIIKWWDREDHADFDVCADDHCQRYQGITAAHQPRVVAAVADTAGLVLADTASQLIDARFSKCCGGATETFDTCWSEHEHHECLQAFGDSPSRRIPDLTDEAEAERWIDGRPDAFCARATPEVLVQVLNDYDRSTTDYYRWEVVWTGEALSENIHRRLPEANIGRVKRLKPLQRGASSRISKLLIEGSEGSVVIGKELLIRKVLSDTHLYSSAFTVSYEDEDADGYPAKIILRGAGWGHGVGLCQIGAAVMGEEGYTWREILTHYFPGSQLLQVTSLQS